jgi:DegV family protein with EDD domain
MSGSRRVAVVTDSTAYLPDGIADKYDVIVVPLRVFLDDECGAEGVDVRPADVAAALSATPRRRVSTSRPNPADFAVAYRAAADSGAEAVVSVHLSGGLSGTVDAARLAAQAAPVPVRVVDSRAVGMGIGFAVIAAAVAATAAAEPAEVARAAEAAAGRTTTYFYVDTLEYLRRGGRIGAASALLGSALSFKPLLQMRDGRIAPLEKVRTAGRAIARLAELAAAAAGEGPVDVAVHHLAAAERAEALAQDLRGRLPGLQTVYRSEVGAVVGAHAGPGLLGVVVAAR